MIWGISELYFFMQNNLIVKAYNYVSKSNFIHKNSELINIFQDLNPRRG